MRNFAKQLAFTGSVKPNFAIEDVEKVLGRSKYSNELYKAATMPGVAVGLAYTYVGGDILFIETTLGEGKANCGLPATWEM
jgi:ATP-dependent Lon protease